MHIGFIHSFRNETGARDWGFDTYLCRVVSLSKDTFTSRKALVIPRKRWLHPNMTEKLFTGTLSFNITKTKMERKKIDYQFINTLLLLLALYIMITSPCKVYPLTPHFYIVKLGFTGVYIFFLYLLQNIDRGYSLEPPQ